MSKKELVFLSGILFIFFLSAYLTQVYGLQIEKLLSRYGNFGPLIYTVLSILSVVIAPLSTFFLLPVAVLLWGALYTAILSLIGWTIGSIIAFLIAKRFGLPIVRRFTNVEKIARIVETLPRKNLFVTILITRMFIPVDILSYAIGLFIEVPLFTYTIATILGIIPFAFIFSFAVKLSPIYYIFTSILVLTVAYFGYNWLKEKSKNST